MSKADFDKVPLHADKNGLQYMRVVVSGYGHITEMGR